MGCYLIIKNNLKRSFNRRVYFTVNFIIPIVIVVLGIFANSISKPSFTIGVLHKEHAEHVVELLRKTEGIRVKTANQDTIKIDLITGKFSAVVDLQDTRYALHSIKDAQTNREIKQILDIYKTRATPIAIEEITGESASVAVRTISFMTLFLMVSATITASFIIKDKKSGTLRRYQVTPQKAYSYMFGNYIYNFILTYVQFMLCVTVMSLLHVDVGIKYVEFLLMGIWICGIATSFATCITSWMREEMYANLYSSFLALVLSLIGGTFISYAQMPPLLQTISVISPLHWFINGTQHMEQGATWFTQTKEISVLSLMMVIMLMLSIYQNKKNKLL